MFGDGEQQSYFHVAAVERGVGIVLSIPPPSPQIPLLLPLGQSLAGNGHCTTAHNTL